MYSRKIYAWSQKRGYLVGIGGIDLLKNVKKELEQRKATKEIDPNFFEENLSFIKDLNTSEIHPPSPDCIIGCMKCQMVCPVNKGRLKYKNTGVSFSSEETHAILDSERMNPKLSEAIAAKFSVLGLSESSDIVFRNFRNFMYNSKRD